MLLLFSYWYFKGYKKSLRWFTFNFSVIFICDALRSLVPFVQFKNVKNTHGGVLLLFTKGSTPPWVFYTFFKLYKWYQIARNIPYKFMIFEAVQLFESCDTSVAASCIMLISSWTTLIWHRSLLLNVLRIVNL